MTLVADDDEATGRAVGIQRQLRQQVDRVGVVDVMAWIAPARDAPVVTLNVGEFARTPVQVSPY